MSNTEEKLDKRPRGRPPIAEVAGHRYQVYLPKSTAERLRSAGAGSLSRGIVNVSKLLNESSNDSVLEKL